jgi:hypothetical protein
MDPWLLRQMDSLQSRLNRSGDNSEETHKLRNEINSMGNFSMGTGPNHYPLYYSASEIEKRIEQLESETRSATVYGASGDKFEDDSDETEDGDSEDFDDDYDYDDDDEFEEEDDSF